eukprot:gene8635-582_t
METQTTTTTTTTDEFPNYTWEEVEEHNQPGDLLVSFEGSVYDATEWAKVHPGGEAIINSSGGKDITDLFISYHKSQSIHIFGTKSCPKVGNLISNKFPIYSVKTGFYSTLKQKVETYFKENDIKDCRRLDMFTIFNTIFIFVGILIAYYFSMYSNIRLLYKILAAVAAGIFHHLMMVHSGHDVSHGCFSRYPIVWSVMGFVGGILLGVSDTIWEHRHIFGHHVFTNVSGIDPDIGIYKASPKEEIMPYRTKHIVMPMWAQKIAYFTVVTSIQIDDFFSFFRGAMEQVKINDTEIEATFRFLGLKFAFFLHRIILPVYFGMSLNLAIALFFVTELTAGCLFGHFSQISHIVDDLEWPADTPIEEDWGEMQVRTSCDYATDSRFWTYLSGHLNYQVCHHLFPSISPQHYEAILPLLKETCQEYNVKYTCYESFWECLSHHYNHLEQFQDRIDCSVAGFSGFRTPLIKTVE